MCHDRETSKKNVTALCSHPGGEKGVMKSRLETLCKFLNFAEGRSCLSLTEWGQIKMGHPVFVHSAAATPETQSCRIYENGLLFF